MGEGGGEGSKWEQKGGGREEIKDGTVIRGLGRWGRQKVREEKHKKEKTRGIKDGTVIGGLERWRTQ